MQSTSRSRTGGLQAVRLLLFLSPSAASSCSGTPDPPSGCRFSPPAGSGGPGSRMGPGPDRISRSRPGLPSRLAEDACSGGVRQGPAGQGRTRARPGPDELRGSSAGTEGGADAGPPHLGGVALFPPSGSQRCYVCVSKVIGAARIWLRRVGSASTPPRCIVVDVRLTGLMAPRGSGRAGLRPSLL